MANSFASKLFFVVLLGSALLLFRIFWTYISAIVLALLIASAFYPLYAWVRKKFGNREQAAALFMTILIFLVLFVPTGGFIGTLSNEAFDFYVRTRDSVSLKQIQQKFEEDNIWSQRIKKAAKFSGIELNRETIANFATSLGRKVGLFLSGQLSAMASNMLSFLIHFFLMLLIIYYIFRDGERLRDYISELLPFPPQQQELVTTKFREMGKAVILGNGISGITQGILGGLGFYLFGLGSPFLWGTVVGFMAFLPIIGASVVFIPATIILLIQGKTNTALGYLAYNVLYSSIMEYVVKPRLIGKGMSMNPILVFIGILGGLKLFGILGIIYGPLIMTIFLTLAEIYKLEYKKTMV